MDTSAATGLTVQQWDDQFFVEAANENQFGSFIGKSATSIIQLKENLLDKKGNKVTFALIQRLTNSAVTGSSTLEGNEEELVTRSQALTITQYRNATRVPLLEEQFSAINLRNGGKEALKVWKMELERDQTIAALGSINSVAYGSSSAAQRNTWLVDNADRALFGAVVSNASSNVHATAMSNIDNTNDKLTPDAISLLKRRGKNASPKIMPVRKRNLRTRSDAYALFTGSLTLRDLKQDSAFTQAQREARERGKNNPLFNDADYIWDNVAIYEIEDIAELPGVGAGSIQVAPVYLCGAQALGFALAKRSETVEETFDYKDKHGVAVRQWHKIGKLTFGTGTGDTDDLKDHGIVTGFFAAVAD